MEVLSIIYFLLAWRLSQYTLPMISANNLYMLYKAEVTKKKTVVYTMIYTMKTIG